MELRELDQWQPGWILARAARTGTSAALAPAGTPLSRELAKRLAHQGLDGVLCVREGEPLPHAPEHLDRYGSDAEARLSAVFGATVAQPGMAHLLAVAQAHAAACRLNYRPTERPTERPGLPK